MHTYENVYKQKVEVVIKATSTSLYLFTYTGLYLFTYTGTIAGNAI